MRLITLIAFSLTIGCTCANETVANTSPAMERRDFGTFTAKTLASTSIKSGGSDAKGEVYIQSKSGTAQQIQWKPSNRLPSEDEMKTIFRTIMPTAHNMQIMTSQNGARRVVTLQHSITEPAAAVQLSFTRCDSTLAVISTLDPQESTTRNIHTQTLNSFVCTGKSPSASNTSPAYRFNQPAGAWQKSYDDENGTQNWARTDGTASASLFATTPYRVELIAGNNQCMNPAMALAQQLGFTIESVLNDASNGSSCSMWLRGTVQGSGRGQGYFQLKKCSNSQALLFFAIDLDVSRSLGPSMISCTR